MNAFSPEPVIIITLISPSDSSPSILLINSMTTSLFIAFNDSGLLTVTIPIPFSFVINICILLFYFQNVLLNNTITVKISNLPSNIQKESNHFPATGRSA